MVTYMKVMLSSKLQENFYNKVDEAKKSSHLTKPQAAKIKEIFAGVLKKDGDSKHFFQKLGKNAKKCKLSTKNIKHIKSDFYASIPKVKSAAATQFKANDFDFTGFSKKDLRILDFAVNCCAYPKLVLHIIKTTKHRDPAAICSAINKLVAVQQNQPLAPADLLPKL